MRFKIAIGLMFFVLISCRKDQFDQSVVDKEVPKTGISKLKRVYGTVYDESGNSLNGVKLSFRGKDHLTDKNGFFDFEDYVSVDRDIIHVQDANYFSSYLNINSNIEGDIVLELSLSAKYVGTRFNTAVRKIIAIEDRISMQFYNDNFLNSDLSPYQGEVIFYYQVKPDYNYKYFQYPNDRLAKIGNREYILDDYMVFAIEAQSAKKTNLLFKDPINLEVPINYTGKDSIYLWKLDVNSGYWNKVAATKVNSKSLQFPVQTNGIYTVSPAIDFVNIRGRFTGINKLEFLDYEFQSQNFGNINSLISDAGSWEVKLPKDKLFRSILFSTENVVLYQTKEQLYNQILNQANVDLVNEKCISLSFDVTTCGLLQNRLSNHIIVREKGSIADFLYRSENKNIISKTIKQNGSNEFKVYDMSIDDQNVYRNKPSVFTNSELIGTQRLEVCNDRSGIAELKLKNKKTGATFSHFFPNTSIQVDTIKSNNTVEINFEFIDNYSLGNDIVYAGTISVINNINQMNPEIRKSINGNPDYKFDFIFNSKTSVFLNSSNNILDQVIINVKNLEIIDNENNEYTATLSGYFFIK
jgi:hypothetical protein